MNTLVQPRASPVRTEAKHADPSQRGLASLSLSMFLSSLGTNIANVALPTLAESFGASFQQVQWIVLAYLLAITALIVSAGRLGDTIGRRRLLMAGLVVFTAASFACAITPSLAILIAARVAQGLGAAVMMSLALAFVGDTVPRERTGGAMGLLGTMSALGTALGPALGGFLISGFGWRVIFLINVPLGILSLLLSRRHLPADRPEAGGGQKRFDHAGAVILAATLTAYALAMTFGRGAYGLSNVALLAAAAIGVFLFVRQEARAESPLIPLKALRNRALSSALAVNSLVSTVMMATLVVGPFFLSRALGLGDAAVGMVMSVGPVVSALCGVPAGRLVDRVGGTRMVAIGLAAMAAGSVALAVLPMMFGVAGYLAAIAILTPGYQQFQAANNTNVMIDVAQDQRGVVSGLLNLSRNLGLVTGASAMGVVFVLASSSRDIADSAPTAIAHGMRITFAVAAALVVIALAIATSRRAATNEAKVSAVAARPLSESRV